MEYEIWKTIPLIPTYECSNHGNIRRKGFDNRTICDNGNGYKIVSVTLNGKTKNLYVHRMVAMLFVGNEFNKTRVNHKDGRKSNNHFSNLEWTTPKENSGHAVLTGLIKSGIGRMNNWNYKPIVDTENGIFYNNVKEAAESKHIVPQTLYKWLNTPHLNKSSFIYA